MLTEEDQEAIKELLKNLPHREDREDILLSLKERGLDQDWADAENPAKGRRPVTEHQPMPWIGGLGPVLNMFQAIDPRRARKAEEQRLCIMCGLGLGLGTNYVYSNLDGFPHDFREFLGAPTPTFVHPRCALQAAAFCPHLQRQPFPALDSQGRGLTHDDLRKLSKVQPATSVH